MFLPQIGSMEVKKDEIWSTEASNYKQLFDLSNMSEGSKQLVRLLGKRHTFCFRLVVFALHTFVPIQKFKRQILIGLDRQGYFFQVAFSSSISIPNIISRGMVSLFQ